MKVSLTVGAEDLVKKVLSELVKLDAILAAVDNETVLSSDSRILSGCFNSSFWHETIEMIINAATLKIRFILNDFGN